MRTDIDLEYILYTFDNGIRHIIMIIVVNYKEYTFALFV